MNIDNTTTLDAIQNDPNELKDNAGISELPLLSDISLYKKRIEYLASLRLKILNSGKVSKADIEGLFSILADDQDDGNKDIGLEDFGCRYSSGYFTSTPSTVNYQLGLEAIGSGVWQTIKRWVKKIIDFIKKVFRSMKRYFSNEEKSRRKLEMCFNVIPQFNKANQQMRPVIGKMDDVGKKANELRDNVFSSRDILHDKVTLSVVIPDEWDKVTTMITQWETQVDKTMKFLDDLLVLAMNGQGGVEDKLAAIRTSFADIATEIGKAPDDIQEYLKKRPEVGKSLKDGIDYDVFTSATVSDLAGKKPLYIPVTDFNKALESSQTHLEAFLNHDTANTISGDNPKRVYDILNIISDNISVFAQMADFVALVNNRRVLVMGTVLNTEKKIFETYYQGLRDHDLRGSGRSGEQMVTQMKNTWNTIRNTMNRF